MIPLPTKPTTNLQRFINEFPVEASGFLGVAAISHIFTSRLAAPLFGISIGLIIAKITLTIFNLKESHCTPYIIKRICKLNRQYPKIQIIAFVFILALSLITPFTAMCAGSVLGYYAGLILNVEKCKLTQKANRRLMQEEAMCRS